MCLTRGNLSAFCCSLRCGRADGQREPQWDEKQRPAARPRGCVCSRPRLGKGCSTRFGELQPMVSSPGCHGRAWPASEKGRGEFENNPAGAKGGRELGSDPLASLAALCSRWRAAGAPSGSPRGVAWHGVTRCDTVWHGVAQRGRAPGTGNLAWQLRAAHRCSEGLFSSVFFFFFFPKKTWVWSERCMVFCPLVSRGIWEVCWLLIQLGDGGREGASSSLQLRDLCVIGSVCSILRF